MDKETRLRIQRATQAARVLLEHEYAEQLEGVFDIRLDGAIEAAPGEHLDLAQQVLRAKLVTAVEHQHARGLNKAETVTAYLREAAFTTLNRLVALKMLEARGLVQECISHGDQSAGFKEFTGLAPGLAQLPDHGYTVYIESLFDEIGREVRILFDRRDPASLLWPRRQPLLEVLEILNDAGLAAVWGEDETIGWVYQYFNSDVERKQMRAASQAPRDSRDLAVRNQFFTPRYVVQFLTDNTLGRIWYEMQRGDTALRDLDYLVRRPNEIFLAEGEEIPIVDESTYVELSQGEMLRQPAPILFRAPKDPRDIRVLDPACGSGHFLLYAFDLLITAYQEAWANDSSPKSQATNHTLREDYPDLHALQLAAPGLILRHNLYGVDIDARCAQIAGMALWMRAQRAFQDLGLDRSQRPSITRTNIVIAEPLPGEVAEREEFVATLPAELARLVECVFSATELAGEAGSLLNFDELINSQIYDAIGEVGSLFRLTDEARWLEAERQMAAALQRYAEQSENGQGYRRRLFADDAVRGFGYIDVLRGLYDVVLMNPPFGRISDGAKVYFDERFGEYKTDIGIAFLAHFATTRLAAGGQVGAIVSRNFLAVDTLKRFRESILLKSAPIRLLLDLGYGVLDSAMVEAALVILSQTPVSSSTFFRALEVRDKSEAVARHFIEGNSESGIRTYVHNPLHFRQLPLHVICYWLPSRVVRKITRLPVLTSQLAAARHGMQTTDDFRFLRLWWEVPAAGVGFRWRFLAKGGEYQPFWDDLRLLVDWGADGKLLKTYLAEKRLRLQGSADWTPWLNHSDYYFVPGLTYPERTTSDFSPRILPENAAFSGTGIAIQFESMNACLAYLGGSYSRAFKLITESFVGSGDNAFAGSAAKRYRSGLLNQLPAPLQELDPPDEALVLESVSFFRNLAATRETSPSFHGLVPIQRDARGTAIEIGRYLLHGFSQVLESSGRIEQLVNAYFGFDAEDEALLDDLVGPHPASYPSSADLDSSELARLWELGIDELSSQVIQMYGARRQVTKKSFVADRKLELIAHLLQASACAIAKCLSDDQEASSVICELPELAEDEVSYAVGAAFGRWDPRWSADLTQMTTENDVFKMSGVSMGDRNYVKTQSILVDDEGHADDIVAATLEALGERWSSADGASWVDAALRRGGLRDYLSQNFWRDHLRRYSESRRKAPIYWQLATPSADYSIWLYYHALTADTFYRVLSDHLTPKLHYEERRLASLKQEVGSAIGGRERKAIEAQERLVEGVRILREEVVRVAPVWRPDLDDGAIINFAPLWRLVPHDRAWQRECKACWDLLCEGHYDWSRLAMHLWPERVVLKCAEDRSLAIVHGLEDVFWYEETEGKWVPRKCGQHEVDELIKERTSSAVKEALESLIEAPAPSTGRSS